MVDYLKTSAYPVMRLWITYAADDDFMNKSSASFILNGQSYTFSGIGNTDWYVHNEDGYLEQMLIKFGMENVDFIAALVKIFSNSEDVTKTAAEASCTLVLHGREDITVEPGEGFFLDFLIIKLGMVDCSGLYYLDQAAFTPMKISDVK